MSPTLQALGYCAFFEEAMQKLDPDLLPARVVGQHRRQWDIAGVDSPLRAVLAGRRWDPSLGDAPDEVQPTVGDWVAVRIVEGEHPVIESVLPRKSSLTRASMARKGVRQAIVANIDCVFIVAAFASAGKKDALAKRSLHPRRLERYIAAVKRGGAETIILANKSDLAEAPEEEAALLSKRLENTRVVCTSCFQEDQRNALLALVEPGKTYGFVGLSGVGKSSLVNLLLQAEAQKVGAEREFDGRGRHTTTHRELFFAPQGALLIDTPGMREFSIADGDAEDLDAFEDIQALAQDCKFRDCGHENEPGCNVQAAVSAGKLPADRVANFLTLKKELAEKSQVHRRRTLGAAKKVQPRKSRSRRDRDFDPDH